MDAPRRKSKKRAAALAVSQNQSSFPLSGLAALFFFSGASALCYEIVWSRTLGLMLGHTIYASSIVLAGFFLGMASGYWLGAKFEVSKFGGLSVYGFLEIFIGIWALCIPSLVSYAASTSGSNLWRDSLIGMIIILPATCCLGATLPVLSSFLSHSGRNDSGKISFVYGANTLGGLVGVFAASFWLIAFFGLTATNTLAAVVSCVCGLVAILIDKQSVTPELHTPSATVSLVLPRTCIIIAIASGLVTMLLQVAYTRLFALVFHNSTYTFALVVAIYLMGLAIGAVVSGLMSFRRHFVFVACSVATLLVATSPFIFALITQLEYFRAGTSLFEHAVYASALVAAVVLLPVVALGTLLPASWQIGMRDSVGSTRQVIGKLTALNSLAAAAGACLASFVVLPTVGLHGAFVIAAAVLCCLLTYLAPNSRSVAFGGACVLVSFIAAQQPYSFAIPQGASLVSRWESGYGWIEILKREYDGVQLLRQDVQYGLGADLDVDWERRQGRLPLLLHSDPRNVAFLGVGTGISVSSIVGDAAIQKVDAVELIPDVVHASKFFASSNLEYYNDPRCTVHATDARHFIANSNTEYDVIVADLFTPWHSRTGYLYTVEHFQNCRKRLRKNGIYCQWLPIWQLGNRDFEIIVDSFRSVFTRCTLWWGLCENKKPLMCLMGSDAPINISAEHFASRLAQIENPESDPFLLSTSRLSHLYIGGWPKRYNCQFNTDDFPRIEFACPESDLGRQKLIGDRIVSYFKDVLARLPQDGVVFGLDSEPIPVTTRLRWQLNLLSTEVARGKSKPLPPRFTDEARTQ